MRVVKRENIKKVCILIFDYDLLIVVCSIIYDLKCV